MNRRNILSSFIGANVLAWATKAFAITPQDAPLPEVPYAPKPKWQEGILPPFISAAPGSKVKAPAPNKTGMRQRRYSGRVDYLDSKRKEIGREFFTVTIQPDGTIGYDETTMLKMREFDEPFAHTDHNTLRKVG